MTKKSREGRTAIYYSSLLQPRGELKSRNVFNAHPQVVVRKHSSKTWGLIDVGTWLGRAAK